MSAWKLIRSPKLPGLTNMQFDLKLFSDFEKGLIPSSLRIYSWRPKCISLGYSQKIERLVDGGRAKKLGWEVVKRPTGGGIVFHNEAEVTYSLVSAIDNPVLPKGLVPSYKKISEAIIYGLKKLGIDAQITNGSTGSPFQPSRGRSRDSKPQLCFSYPAEYEIVVNGKKIVGSAQKRGRKALLQQGSIFVRRTPDEVLSVLKQKYDRVEAISVEEVLGRKVSFEELSEGLVKGFEECFGIGFDAF